MLGIGKAAHYCFDLLLISMLLASMRRDTGLYLDPNSFASYDVRRYLVKYLNYGEKAYDYFVSLVKYSGYFKVQKFNNLKRFVSDVNNTVNNDKIQQVAEEYVPVDSNNNFQ